MPPRVAVVMSVHNGWPYLSEAVESVLAQTYPHTSLVVVDDASTDEGAEYLARLEGSGVTVLRNTDRIGLAASLRRAIDGCDCDMVARLDADDVAEPWRIAAQVECLEGARRADLVCSSALLIGEHGERLGRYDVPRHPQTLLWALCLGNPIIHSSVMFRIATYRSLGGYLDREPAEDYDLWSRFMAAGSEMACLRRPAVRVRKHGSQVSETRRAEMLGSASLTAQGNIGRLLGGDQDPVAVTLLMHPDVASRTPASKAVDLLSRVTAGFLAKYRPGLGARREISGRALGATREIAAAAGLARPDASRALRTCIAGAGYLGLSTGAGMRSALRLLAPERPVRVWRRLRRRDQS